MSTKTNFDDLKMAEGLKHLKPLPTVPETPKEIKEKEPILDNPEEFRMAIGHAQLDGRDYVEVSERLFKYLIKNQDTPYLTYGDPGIKVYLEGTKEKIDSVEKLSCEERMAYENKLKYQANLAR